MQPEIQEGRLSSIKHDEISMEPYSGNPFVNKEMLPSDQRDNRVRFYAPAMGVDFNWTFNQDTLFSFALTGKPSRKEAFGEYRWNCCVIGSQEDYVMANECGDWVVALQHGNLCNLRSHCDDLANNTNYAGVCVPGSLLGLSVASSMPQLLSPKRRTEYQDIVATECLRGVATYLKGDLKQGCYSMALSDLMNTHYTKAVTEGLDSFRLERVDNEVAVGDIVEMLLNISFACKDAMLDWEWLGVGVCSIKMHGMPRLAVTACVSSLL